MHVFTQELLRRDHARTPRLFYLIWHVVCRRSVDEQQVAADRYSRSFSGTPGLNGFDNLQNTRFTFQRPLPILCLEHHPQLCISFYHSLVWLW